MSSAGGAMNGKNIEELAKEGAKQASESKDPVVKKKNPYDDIELTEGSERNSKSVEKTSPVPNAPAAKTIEKAEKEKAPADSGPASSGRPTAANPPAPAPQNSLKRKKSCCCTIL